MEYVQSRENRESKVDWRGDVIWKMRCYDINTNKAMLNRGSRVKLHPDKEGLEQLFHYGQERPLHEHLPGQVSRTKSLGKDP